MKQVKDSFENAQFEQEYCSKDAKFRYMLLSRMQSDCDYYLGNGQRYGNHLWAHNEEEQIKDMISLWNSFGANEKPEWLTYDELNDYAVALTGKSLEEFGFGNYVVDSQKVDDMVKPAMLHGYAKMRREAMRQKNKELENKNANEEEDVNEKQEVNDSQRVQDDSLDDFNPGSAVRGAFNDEGYLHIYANTNLTRKEFISAIEPALAGVTIDYFYEGKRFRDWSESTYFYVTLPNMKEAVAPFIDAIKGKIYCIHFKIDNNPTGQATIWSPQTSWDANTSTEKLMSKMQISDSRRIKDDENELYELIEDILQRDVLEKNYRKHPFTLYRQLPNGGIELETYKDTLKRSGVDYIKQLIKDWTGIDVEVKVGDEHSILGGETKVTLEVYPKATADISDSSKIKDEQAVPLDGMLMVAFKDGQEDEGYNAIKEHANEQGEISGAQYETYDVDNSDGVAIIDLCAATKDANAFVKALLKEWGLLDKVEDLKFEASDLMENAQEEVSDSKHIKDMVSPLNYANYDGYDLSYDTMYDEAYDAYNTLLNNGQTHITWQDVAEEMGMRLETLNKDDYDLLYDVIEDVLSDDKYANIL